MTLTHTEVSLINKAILLGDGAAGVAAALKISQTNLVTLAVIALGVATLNACDLYDKGVIIKAQLPIVRPTCIPIR